MADETTDNPEQEAAPAASAKSAPLKTPNHRLIDEIEKRRIHKHPSFRAGDTIAVHFRIREGDKERVQVFEGVCIAMKRRGPRETVTVRKMSFSQGVERIFPLQSPRVEKIEVVQRGRVRRAKLFYLRELRGKKARIREKMDYGKKASSKKS